MGCTLFGFFLTLVTLVSSISEAKFLRGDQFQYTSIEGALSLQCAGQTKSVNCRDTFLDPWPYDIYVGTKNPNATSVELVTSVGGIQTQDVVVKYDGVNGKSEQVNLGVYSLFQKPMLKLGINQVRYILLGRSGNVLETNTFTVAVTRGNTRTCESRVITTPNPDDCDHPYSACQVYFRNLNFCR
jgi:hypothetical protein